MSLKMPAAGHPCREMFDTEDLVRALPSFPLARRHASDTIKRDPKLIKSVNSLCLRADGEVWLVTFRVNREGYTSHKRVWNFGKGRPYFPGDGVTPAHTGAIQVRMLDQAPLAVDYDNDCAPD